VTKGPKPRSKEPDGRGARLVGSVVDPAADDGLSLTGPGAPGASFSPAAEHPVKARLLARARLARGEASEEDARLLAGHDAYPAEHSAATAPLTLPAQKDAQGNAQPDDGEATAAEDSPALTQRTLEQTAEPKPSTTAQPTPSPGAVAEELDRIIGRSSTSPHKPRPALSPNLAGLLAALIGLSVLGTVGLFLEPTTFSFGPSTPPTQPSAVPAPASEPLAVPVERPQRSKLPGPWRIADDQAKPEHRVISGKIGKLAFLKAIEQAGLPKNEAYRAYGALKEILDLDHCHPKDAFRALVLRRDRRLVAFEYEKSKEEVYQAKIGESGKLVGQKLDLAVQRNQIRRAFVYDGVSFDESARRAGFDDGLSQVAEQAFRGHLGLRELKTGDRLRVIAQEVTVLGDFARYAGIEAIEIVRAGRDPQRIYYFSHPEEGGYFDETGRAPYEGGWRKPIQGAPVTSKFNMKRLHPVLKKIMPHTGTDFGAPTGTPIGSTAPGVVSFIGNGGPSGNLVKVKHDGGYESGYAHLSRFEAGLSVGDPVERLETVGYCGTTGRSTGPHLHFTMKKNGEYIDPESLNLDGLRVLGTAHRGDFAEIRQKYDAILAAIQLPEVPQALLQPNGPIATGAEVDEAVAGSDETSDAMLAAEAIVGADAPVAAATGALPGAGAPKSTVVASPSGKPAPAVGGSAIFLTDADLLQMQGAVHEGEVTE
jgi:murein DD-endopeptidase MepM/ murein hydrolase activator NlpD